MNQTSIRPIIALSATFTADPVRRPLSIWLRELCRDDVIRTAPYNQVLQSLLDPNSILVRPAGGSNVLLVCFQDWLRDRVDDLAQVGREFSDALSDFVCQSASPTLVYFLPPSPDLDRDALDSIQAAEQRALQSLEPLSGLHLITSEQLDRCYPVANRFDPVASRTGQIHYSQLYFTAIATSIARHLYGLRSRPRKVIVSDADNTLWSGVCGEVGPNGVTVEAAHAELQKRLIQLRAQGFLVALCSKNSPQDVWDVFDLNPSMLLRREHIVAHELSWRPKSQGLRAIAATLGVGLDSLVLLDDNPVEIAEVRSNLPQATAIQILSTERLVSFLDHLWPLDRLRVTDDDLSRADSYAVEAKRNELRREMESLAQFLQRLDLKVTFRQLDESSLERAAQLTQRTNQFNCTLRRSSRAELSQYMGRDGHHAWVVDVSDRFGDYGTVGLMAARCERAASDVTRFEVDWFLLSCRALGRSVEHHMLRHLAQAAIDQQLGRLSISLTQGPRNQPATMFLDAMAQQLPGCETSGSEFRFPVDMVARIDPTSMAANVAAAADEAQSTTQSTTGESRSNAADPADSDSELIQRIASEWSSPESFQQHIEQFASERPDLAEPYCGPTNDIEQTLAADVCNLLHLSQVGVTDPLHALGASSLMIVQLHSRIALSFGVELPITQLYNAATIRDIANHLISAKRDPAMSLPPAANDTTHMPATAKQVNSPEIDSSAMAVIGMAGRFPGAENVAEFWQCLIEGRSGVKSIQPHSANQLQQDPNYVAMAATVELADCFDATFFGILPRHAQEMDPQHRLFLEVCWQTLEDAGYRPDATKGKVGVFAGCHMNTYLFLRLAADATLRASLANSFPGGNLTAEILNDKDYLATRIAYHLNLRGPTMAVQTACSTSLVAVAQACQSLEAGDCYMALAGGSCITFPQNQGYLHTEDSILSPDGLCRTFDADAKGTIFADGVGAVLLKRLVDAQRDGDAIYAVIKGWGVNNDGGDKGGYTAPSVKGQTGAILRAHQKAGIAADTISYVEAHGTGTLVGDPIEIAALTAAFRETTDKTQFCSIGSLKSNFGHLDVAAGVAAVIKTVLALQHRKLPPLLHYRDPNPRIDFANSPFYPQTHLADWPEPRIGDRIIPRQAGVSSFGVGGTNAHLVLGEHEQTDSRPRNPEQASPHLLCISAGTPESLQQMRGALADRLESEPEISLRDASFTLMAGRKPMAFRFSAAGSTTGQWLEQLRSAAPMQPATTSPKRLFLFPGQGSQHVGMAAELYRGDHRFAKHLDEAAEALLPHTGLDLRLLIFGEAKQSSRLDQTAYAQPSIFMVSYALARWLQELGIEPDYVMGHSVGEFAAAVVAGIMTLVDGARLIAARGRLMQQLPTGSMLAVTAESSKLSEFLPQSLEIAALNAPFLNVVSGPTEEIRRLEQEIESGHYGEETTGRMLRTSHAFHSAMMDAAIEPFGKIVAECSLSKPRGPMMISTVTADQMTESVATSGDYWAHQIRRPVAFSDTIARLLASERKLLICEVGPNQALTALVRQQRPKSGSQFVVPMLPHVKDSVCEHRFAIAAIGKLWQAGQPLDANQIFAAPDTCRRLHLPTYCFERKRHWFEASQAGASLTQMAASDEFSTQSQTTVQTPSIRSEPPSIVTEDGAKSQFGVELIQHQMEIMRQQLELLRDGNHD